MRRCINFGSYNYLGFAENSGPCTDTAERLLRQNGVAGCSSRMQLGRRRRSDPAPGPARTPPPDPAPGPPPGPRPRPPPDPARAGAPHSAVGAGAGIGTGAGMESWLAAGLHSYGFEADLWHRDKGLIFSVGSSFCVPGVKYKGLIMFWRCIFLCHRCWRRFW